MSNDALQVANYRNTNLLATKAEITAAGCNLYGLRIINPNTSPAYVKLYAAPAASVTVGTTTPQSVVVVPPGDGVTPGMVTLRNEQAPLGYFGTGLTIAAVTTLADAGTTALGTGLNVEAQYK